MYEKIYYKELAHTILEAEKPPQSAAVCKLETSENQWCSLKA